MHDANSRNSSKAATSLALRAVTLLIGFGTSAAAADVFVDSYQDDFVDNGNCTLREAIYAANNDMAIDDCNAGNGDDTIVVPPGVIQLTLAGSDENEATDGDLDIRAGVEIIGAGPRVTIVDGGAIERVFHVDPSGNRNFSVTLRGMTIRNGAANAMGGGGLFNNGILSLRDVSVVDNTASDDAFGGGINNNHSLNVYLGEIAGNSAGDGGGIFAEGGSLETVITGSTVRGNAAVNTGGGMQLNDTFRVEYSAIIDNEAGLRGGGAVTANLQEDGSGFFQSTISGNSAVTERGGGIFNQGVLDIYRSTIAGNDAPEGGGIHHAPSNGGLNVNVGLSILAANTGGNCAGTPVVVSDFGTTAGAYNLDDADTCGFNDGNDTSSLVATDPVLGPLADNGGPTPTRAPDAGSPAIDAVDAADIAICELTEVDQRSAPGTVPGTDGGPDVCDIGALETNLPIIVDSEADEADLTPGDGVCDSGAGDCTLRAAIQEANAGDDGLKVIELPAGTFGLSILGINEDAGATGDLDIEDYVVIVGAGTDETVIDGNAVDRVLHVVTGTLDYPFLDARLYPVLDLRSLTVQNGSAATGGGGIDSAHALSLDHVVIRDNRAAAGAGVECGQCTLRVRDSRFSDNRAVDDDAGGVAAGFTGADYRSVLLERVTFDGNTALDPVEVNGGAIDARGLVHLRNVTVSGNEASNRGGGIHLQTPVPALIENSTITGNTAATGGAIYAGSAEVVLRQTIVSANAVSDGQNAGRENCFATDPDRIRSLGGNLEDRNQCGLDPALGDLTDSDPLLEPLADNGGPTPTHALMAGSPAIDSGGDECPGTDQRGVARPQDGDLDTVAACDIGAYELQTPADVGVTATDSPDPVVAGNDVTYTITVTNDGPGAASGITLTTTIPADVTLVSATVPQGSCNASATSIDCDLGALDAGGSIQGTVVVTTGSAGALDVTVSVSAAGTDPVSGNNTATVTTTVNSAGGPGGSGGSGGGGGASGWSSLLMLLAFVWLRARSRRSLAPALLAAIAIAACGGGASGGGGAAGGGGGGGGSGSGGMPPFSFADRADVPLVTLVESNEITVSGLSGAGSVSIAGGEYSIDGGGYTTAAGTVNNGQQVRVRVTSADLFYSTVTATLTIAGVRDDFDVTTVVPYFFAADDGATGLELWATDGTPAHTNLVMDIDSVSNQGSLFGNTHPVVLDGVVYFVANDGVHGSEPWRSDGTSAGTFMIRDINPGPGSSNPARLTATDSAVYFAADEDGGVGNARSGLWRTTGSDAARVTTNLVVLGSGTLMPETPEELFAVGDLLYFSAFDNFDEHGRELWVTDGTSPGTGMVHDAAPGTASSHPRNLLVVGSGPGALVYFTTFRSGRTGLWRTNGSSATTVELLSEGVDESRDPEPVQGTVYFVADADAAGLEPWKTDGTVNGTVRVRDINAGPEDSRPGRLTALGSTLIFSADDGINGRELWTSDGTEAGTGLVRDIRTGADSALSDPSGSPPFIQVDGAVFFRATNFFGDTDLWMSDGTATGTTTVSDVDPDRLTVVGDTLYFAQREDGSGAERELWRRTANGTIQSYDLHPGSGSSAPDHLTAVGNNLYFTADDGANGRELWRIGPNLPAGTNALRVSDIAAGTGGVNFRHLTAVGDELFGAIDDGINGGEPWWSDGATAAMVTNINTRIAGGGLEIHVRGVRAKSRFVMIDGIGFFVADDGISGPELWRSDGTAAGTFMLADINPGPAGSHPTYLRPLGGELLFRANEGTSAFELWRSDGTQAGTARVRDIRPGEEGSFPESLLVWSGNVYFNATDGINGEELWRSDGSAAGTDGVIDLYPGPGSSSPTWFAAADTRFYFHATDGTRTGIWLSDGTAAGTQFVSDVNVDLETPAVAIGDTLYFAATDTVNGRELWTTDGTPAGTTIVLDVYFGGSDAAPRNLVVFDGRVWFSAADGVRGRELWHSDGTAAGTRLVLDINPGLDDGDPRDLTVSNGRLYFTAGDGVTGREVWIDDGSAAVLLRDINPDAQAFNGSSEAGEFAAAHGRTYFRAFDGVNGREPWTSDGTTTGTAMLLDVYPGAASGTPLPD